MSDIFDQIAAKYAEILVLRDTQPPRYWVARSPDHLRNARCWSPDAKEIMFALANDIFESFYDMIDVDAFTQEDAQDTDKVFGPLVNCTLHFSGETLRNMKPITALYAMLRNLVKVEYIPLDTTRVNFKPFPSIQRNLWRHNHA
jgi:hypothetical protein